MRDASRSTTAPVSTSTMRTAPSRAAYASRWPAPGSHTGARSAASASSRRSPLPSPATTRSCPREKYAIRVSVLRAAPARERHVRPRERPAHRPVRLERDELVRARRDDEAAERRPRRLAVVAEQPLRAVLRRRPRRPSRRSTSSRPGAGSEKSAGCASSTPTTSRISSRTARPGGLSSPATTTTRERDRPRPASTIGAAAAARAPRTRRDTTAHERSRASCSPGISIRSSSRFTPSPRASRARGAGAS